MWEMSDRSEKPDQSVIKSELEFFASYYGEEKYNLVGWRLRMERELRLLRLAAGPDGLKRVLSIGCGDGRFELMVARHAEFVTAIDISPEAIELAKENAAKLGVSNVEFRCMPVSEFSWEARFDVVLCVAFLHHLPEPKLPDFLRDVFVHTAPGGLLFTQDPNVNGILRKVGRVVLGSRYDNYHSDDERELDPEEMKRELASAGFESLRWNASDLTLTPLSYILADGPAWPLRFCSLLDRVWCSLPLDRWASGYVLTGRRPSD